ncbi:MAG: DUF1080 domain-containing protein [Opitutaceae bacterium]|nr:DUF1080 domain-containing protein [Opitutaceae bacterium]
MKTFLRCGTGGLSFFGLAVVLTAGPWQSLFNGRDLTGWRVVNGTAPYAVADGAIVGTTVRGTPNSFLAADREFGDFIFECEVRHEGGPANSGIQIRSLVRPDYREGRLHGYQVELDPSARAWTGGIYDEARRGWLYPPSLNPRALTAYEPGRWNHVRVEAIGPVIRTWINGIPVAHLIDDVTPAGLLALQVHSVDNKPGQEGRRILWRNLRIQTTDLVPSPPDGIFIRNTGVNTVSPEEQARGWRLLWDGRTARGWRGADGRPFPAAGWSLADGVLTVLGRDGGDIVTEEEFSAFELQLEFQLTEGANSGIKYFVSGRLGLEYQLLDDERHPDATKGAAGNRTLASLYDLIPREPLPEGTGIEPKIGEWQHARLVVRPDGSVEHWLNGVNVVSYRRGSPLFQALVARSKFAENPGFGLAARGPILLQDHQSVVRFRSIKIRPLTE